LGIVEEGVWRRGLGVVEEGVEEKRGLGGVEEGVGRRWGWGLLKRGGGRRVGRRPTGVCLSARRLTTNASKAPLGE
jgi:hypothetical protein